MNSEMLLQNNLRPFIVSNWSPTSHLKKPENGSYDKLNFVRSAVFNCQAIEDDAWCMSSDAAATLARIYASSPGSWILDVVGQGEVK